MQTVIVRLIPDGADLVGTLEVPGESPVPFRGTEDLLARLREAASVVDRDQPGNESGSIPSSAIRET